MTPKEHLIRQLAILCRDYGPDAVAGKARVSVENLKQILAGTKLPNTGAPRGVGPLLQRKLEAAYPGWSGIAASPPARPDSRFTDRQMPSASEWATLEDIRALPTDEQEALRKELRERGEKFRAYRDKVIADMKGKS